MRDATSYRVIAPYYDAIMAHVDYDAWGRYLGRLWRKFGSHPSSILELGAGTCPFDRRRVFPHDALTVYADLSPFMLAQGRDTSGPAGNLRVLDNPREAVKPRVAVTSRVAVNPRVAANALALPFRGPFQLCLMVYDALNYLMREEDLARCLAEVRRVLAPGGLFIFDVTTEANSRRHFDQSLDFGEMQGCVYVRESTFDRAARLQRNDFTFFVEQGEGLWRKLRECHQQRIYRLARIKAMARRAGFELAGCFEGFTFRPGRETSERVHFALKKPGKTPGRPPQ